MASPTRQSEFLVTVMLHSGVCMDRHYCAFARIPHGRRVVRFFPLPCQGSIRHWLRLCAWPSPESYHVHHKPLYEAIGEPDNRFRRPVPVARAVERLDVARYGPRDVRTRRGSPRRATSWRTSACSSIRDFDRGELPHLTFRSGDRSDSAVLSG